MIAQLFIFFIAGYETTATTVTVILNFLAKYPQYIEKIRKEAEQEITDMNRIGFRHLETSPFQTVCHGPIEVVCGSLNMSESDQFYF